MGVRLSTAILVAAVCACVQQRTHPLTTADAGTHASSSCVPCVSDYDCQGAGESCVQFPFDSVCLHPCARNADCAASEVCFSRVSVEGVDLNACLATNGSCEGTVPDLDGGLDAGQADAGATDSGVDAGQGGYCDGLAGPDIAACCHCATGHTCSANDCYNGYYCNTSTCRCVAPPDDCVDGGSDGGSGAIDAGGSITASNGGTVPRLYFAAVGDTRPAVINDTAHYPTAIITGIYGAVAQLQPAPQFVVTTGDYMFASTGKLEAAPQMADYMAARNQFSGIVWSALGNHECTGATASNCGTGNTSGITKNYTSYLDNMVTPIGETNPYWVRRVDGTDGSWTAKFIFLAPNAWTNTQKSWFQTQLQTATTYTFVIQHEPAGTGSAAPGIVNINGIKSGASITLSIVGHSHLWRKTTNLNEVVVGNGGAPLSSGTQYGYTIFQQRANGDIIVTAYDYTTNQSFSSFVVKPDGTPTQ